MKSYRQRIGLLLVICAVLLSPLAEGWIPSASAAVSGTIDFSQPEIPGHYEDAGTVVAMDNFELWHHSGGYWSNQLHGLVIQDKDLDRLADGKLDHKDLKQSISITKSLPREVIGFLNKGGSLDEVKLKFSTGYGLNPDELYEHPKYSLTNKEIKIDADLIFNVDEDPFAKVDGVSFDVWKPLDGYGKTGFSIFTRSGQHLGAAYTGDRETNVQQGDILNAQGHLRGGKQYAISTGSGTITRDGSEIQIGSGTFASGGAVGMHFIFPLRVDFYIPSLLDNVIVHYVDESGRELLPSEERNPSSTGAYTVEAKQIAGYVLISPASQTVTIGENRKTHEVTFMYRLAGPDPYAVTTGRTNPKETTTNGEDVQVRVTVQGELKNYADASNITKWTFYARHKEDSSTLQTKEVYTRSLNAETDFYFTIPYSKLNGSSYTQYYTIRAVPTFINPVNGSLQPESNSAEVYSIIRDLGGPVAEFRWSPRSPDAGDYVDFIDESYHPQKLEIVEWEWRVDGRRFSTDQNPEYEFKEADTYAVTLTVTDENGKSDSITYHINVNVPNAPPVARFVVQEEIYLGEVARVRDHSYDRDGEIVKRWWYQSGHDHQVEWSTMAEDAIRWEIKYSEIGEYEIELIVMDDVGYQEMAIEYVNVLPPYPIAELNFLGELKVNRKVTIDASDSFTPDIYPMLWDQTKLTIEPLTGQNVSTIKYHGQLNGHMQKDVLFKEPGLYRVTLEVTNIFGLSDRAIKSIYIDPDLPPIANFSTFERIYRDPEDGNMATIRLLDVSQSPDGDAIQQRIWKYRYDADNDGDFEEHDWIMLDDGNLTEITVKHDEVGRYQFHLWVKEDFVSETIPEFVTDEDYLRDDTDDKPMEETIVTIDNRPPVAEWDLP